MPMWKSEGVLLSGVSHDVLHPLCASMSIHPSGSPPLRALGPPSPEMPEPVGTWVICSPPDNQDSTTPLNNTRVRLPLCFHSAEETGHRDGASWLMALSFGLQTVESTFTVFSANANARLSVTLVCVGTARYFPLSPHTDQTAVPEVRLLSEKNRSHLWCHRFGSAEKPPNEKGRSSLQGQRCFVSVHKSGSVDAHSCQIKAAVCWWCGLMAVKEEIMLIPGGLHKNEKHFLSCVDQSQT